MAKAKLLLDWSSIKRLINYNPDTGIFTWLPRPLWPDWTKRYVGKRVGFIDREGYIKIRIGGLSDRAHRWAWFWMTGEWPRPQIDHINMNRADNRWNNLRLATISQNRFNRPHTRLNKSGFKGVCLHKHSGLWKAEITANKVRHFLGYYHTAEEASVAYARMAKKLHGDFARLN